jgi:excisionase family DNA binding protein
VNGNLQSLPAVAGPISNLQSSGLLTFSEAAAKLRVSVWTIRRLVRERALPVITLSPRVRRIAATDLPTMGVK